jgi:hypothetical protein
MIMMMISPPTCALFLFSLMHRRRGGGGGVGGVQFGHLSVARLNDSVNRTCGIAPRSSKWGRQKWSAWGEGPPKRTTYMSRVAVSNLLY